MIGLLDGWNLRGFTQETIKGKEIIVMSSGGKFMTDDLANMVTSIYADTENVGLPVGWVAMGCLSVQRGETTRDLVFKALRKHLADLMGSQGTHYGNEVDPIDVILRSRLN